MWEALHETPPQEYKCILVLPSLRDFCNKQSVCSTGRETRAKSRFSSPPCRGWFVFLSITLNSLLEWSELEIERKHGFLCAFNSHSESSRGRFNSHSGCNKQQRKSHLASFCYSFQLCCWSCYIQWGTGHREFNREPANCIHTQREELCAG